MFHMNKNLKVVLAVEPVDLRKSFNGLYPVWQTLVKLPILFQKECRRIILIAPRPRADRTGNV